MKPKTPLPWNEGDVLNEICLGSPDVDFIVHACNAYPRFIETYLKAKKYAERLSEPIGVVEYAIEDLLKELGEL